MSINVNQAIYNKNYSDHNVRLAPKTAYDRRMINLRFSLIDQYGTNKDVLDLGCGTGSYLIPKLDQVKSAVGVDFSSTMLAGFRSNLGQEYPAHLKLVEANAQNLPLTEDCVDFVFSYTTLYHVPKIENALKEVGRILRPGGYAALELGNLYSINTIICNYNYNNSGWAKPFHISYPKMQQYLQEAGLKLVKQHTFQLLNTYGAPKRLFYLYPLVSPHWKKVLGIQVGGQMLDEWISGSWPLRYLAFRHLFVVRKQ